MSPTRGLYINRIFGTGGRNRGLLRPLHASTRYCSASGNGALSLCQKNYQIVKTVEFQKLTQSGVTVCHAIN